ncbi:Pycsar system effector family protein [Spongiactinospora sp. 9N601]|uniref:Pycsar system effector family protein n=1 Tax=Spongiactinospora sp. 9N601 TaxID=3375149 RepID=UPI0037B9A3CC
MRGEATRADNKASVLLGVTGVAVGAVLGGLFADSWRPAHLGSAEWLWWCGTVLIGVSIALFLAVVYPRGTGGRSPKMVGYYGDAVRQRSAEGLLNALERSAQAEMEVLADQIYVMSKLVRTKYLLTRAGVWTFAVAAGLWLLSALRA